MISVPSTIIPRRSRGDPLGNPETNMKYKTIKDVQYTLVVRYGLFKGK
jgi:hypothetical protein